MAIGAQKHALACLFAEVLQPASKPSRTDREALRTGVEVMELERRRVQVKSARDAATTGLRDQNFLDTSSASGDPLGSAAGAAIDPFTVQHESHVSVTLTLALEFRDAGSARGACNLSAHCWPRAQAQSPEPVTNRCLTAPEFFSDAALRQARGDQPLKHLPIHTRMVARGPDRLWERVFG